MKATPSAATRTSCHRSTRQPRTKMIISAGRALQSESLRQSSHQVTIDWVSVKAVSQVKNASHPKTWHQPTTKIVPTHVSKPHLEAAPSAQPPLVAKPKSATRSGAFSKLMPSWRWLKTRKIRPSWSKRSNTSSHPNTGRWWIKSRSRLSTSHRRLSPKTSSMSQLNSTSWSTKRKKTVHSSSEYANKSPSKKTKIGRTKILLIVKSSLTR